ncbi:MAG: RpiB/LacA/LacB family sugar-phosphate isomerase [Candidatus Daviesbacteria bacterium]|nr:MAG: RpiB/LacA/LacB family sugar-phosphate isomerase [Candidatus Daviesbacteria bacterium]
MIFIGADHRGFELKERLKKNLIDEGYEITDLGNDHLDGNDDYVIFAEKVAKAVVNDIENRGIILCGSGVGVDMVANKIDGVRSALVFDIARAKQAREHEDANVISLPADVLDEETALEIVKTFLTTQFSGEERHVRRLEELEKVEEEN